MKKKWKGQEGMATLEGMILLLLALFIMIFFLAFGFIFYQRWVVMQVANDTAVSIAQNYAYPDSDLVTGFMTSNTRSAMSPFRYFSDTIKSKNIDRGKKYAQWNLQLSSLAIPAQTPQINIEVKRDSLALRHVEVTIDAKYKLLFQGLFDALGYGNGGYEEYQYTAAAQITDISDYINTIGTINDLSDSALSSKIGKAIKGATSVVNFLNTMITDLITFFDPSAAPQTEWDYGS